MNDMNPRAVIGGNTPPDPIDTAVEPFGDIIEEATSWLDGTPVENEAQMKAVDDLTKGIKSALKAVNDARDAETQPLHSAWKAEIARWKPTLDDLERMAKGLVAIVAPYKAKLAAEKEAAKRAAYEAAQAAERAAEAAAREADAGNIEQVRAAEAAALAAIAAKIDAQSASRDTVKGMRTVWHFEVTDYSDALKWMNKNARADLEAAALEYARKHHREQHISGVRSWQTKEAY